MRERWEELRAKLEPGRFWQSHDRLKAIRLLGLQPLAANEAERVAEIFVASHALNPVGDSPFDDVLSDMGTTALVRYRKAVKAQWPDLVSTKDTAQCRQLLIALADRNIARLDAKLQLLDANAYRNAERTVARLSVDQSRDGERLRAYQMKCVSAFYRGIETYRKYQGKKRAEGRERRIDDEPRMVEDGGRRIPDFARWPAGGGRGPEGAALKAEDGGRRIPDFARWGDELDASNQFPDGSFAAGDGERETFEPSIDWDALPDGGAQPGCGNGTVGATQSASATMMADTTLSDGGTLPDDTSASASVTLSEGGGRRTEGGGKTDPRFLPPSLLRPPTL
jgi:hypothetical protein